MYKVLRDMGWGVILTVGILAWFASWLAFFIGCLSYLRSDNFLVAGLMAAGCVLTMGVGVGLLIWAYEDN